jgi:2-polyprenyl-3-methyl-5-hydroxy-6-metoxy-1,4-benzoquinol methylase
LLSLSDDALLTEWKRRAPTTLRVQDFGWYHALYADGMRGKKILDLGSGFGIDSITLAQHGASLTFVDLVEENLAVLKRLCGILNLRDVRFHVLHEIDSLAPLDPNYDVIMAIGSLHHAPPSVIGPECAELLRHLKIGGRWLQLAYPKCRWNSEFDSLCARG